MFMNSLQSIVQKEGTIHSNKCFDKFRKYSDSLHILLSDFFVIFLQNF